MVPGPPERRAISPAPCVMPLRLPLPCSRLRLTSSLTFVLLICLETALLSCVNCTKTFTVHWNTTNPIFRIDNTDHIIDVNKGNVKFEYDQVNIICPVYVPGTNEEDAEKYIIYNVSKEEYDTCRITNPSPKIIAVCNQPHKLMYFTITFRSFTPQPGGLEFQPGEDYYFISTSSKEDIHRRIGGRCTSHNMKVVFKVCCRPTSNSHNHTMVNRIPTTSFSSSPSTLRPAPVPTYSPTPVPTSRMELPTARPTSYKDIDLSSYNVKSTTKKTNEYEKHPNEVVKNEELTYNLAARKSASTHSHNLLLLLSACAVAAAQRWGLR